MQVLARGGHDRHDAEVDGRGQPAIEADLLRAEVAASLQGADDEEAGPWPPWPITRAEIEAFATGTTGLAPVKIEEVADAGQEPPGRRWLAEFRRPGG